MTQMEDVKWIEFTTDKTEYHLTPGTPTYAQISGKIDIGGFKGFKVDIPALGLKLPVTSDGVFSTPYELKEVGDFIIQGIYADKVSSPEIKFTVS
ncbi:MAG: hypothetical protein IH841_08095 [Thaumarchaeota archaeon]|nr:hypothetical protein [Nitrososphaerota archaeon]